MKMKRDREEACITCGHYHDVEGGEPCSICGHVMAAPGNKHESCMPSTIIPGFLYLGNYDTASRQELLRSLGITHILNTVPKTPPLYKNTFTYHTVERAPPDFEDCFPFLDAANQEQRKVLVYCMSALTRSPTVVVAYLMKLRGWRLAEAYKWVKDKRPQIAISENDTKRLQALEVELHGSCSVPSGFAFLSLPALPTQPQQPCSQQTFQQPQPGLFGLWAGAAPHAADAAHTVAFGSPAAAPFFAPPAVDFVFGAAQPPAAAAAAAAAAAPAQGSRHSEMMES